MVIITTQPVWSEKTAALNENRHEVSETFRLHAAVAFQQPRSQLKLHEHCAGQALTPPLQVGLQSQSPPEMPSIWEAVLCDYVIDRTVVQHKNKMLGPEDGNEYTNGREQDTGRSVWRIKV